MIANTDDLAMIAQVDAAIQTLALGPWCPDWMASAIRHLDKNCDLDCFADGHSYDARHSVSGEVVACNRPGRYDGNSLAIIRNNIERLIELAKLGAVK